MNGKGVVERRQVQGVEIASDRRYEVAAGQFIISRIDARNGASGLIPNELNGAVVTNDFPLFDVAQDKLDPAFLNWMSKTASFVDLCKRASEGTTNRVWLAASAEDVVAGPDPKLPVSLSPKAIEEGWRGVAYSAPEKVSADSLAEGLRDYVYEGVSAWWLFGRPMLNSLAVLMLLYVLRLQMKQGFGRRREQEERHGRRTQGPELASALLWRGAKTDGIRFRLRFENAPLRWLPFGPSYRIPKRLEASHILMMGDTGSGKSNAIRQLLRQVRERGESAIVYDPAMDFVGEFYSPARGDLILNPLDQRCPYWGLSVGYF